MAEPYFRGWADAMNGSSKLATDLLDSGIPVLLLMGFPGTAKTAWAHQRAARQAFTESDSRFTLRLFRGVRTDEVVCAVGVAGAFVLRGLRIRAERARDLR